MLYKEICVDDALDTIAGDWDYFDDTVVRSFFAFKDVGDNVVGIRMIERETVAEYGQKAMPIALPVNRKNYEIGPDGLVEVPRIPFSAHVTRAGTPHRTTHAFGYWHINDKDEIIVPLPPEGERPARIIIIMGKPRDGEADRFAWYDPQCPGTPMRIWMSLMNSASSDGSSCFASSVLSGAYLRNGARVFPRGGAVPPGDAWHMLNTAVWMKDETIRNRSGRRRRVLKAGEIKLQANRTRIHFARAAGWSTARSSKIHIASQHDGLAAHFPLDHPRRQR